MPLDSLTYFPTSVALDADGEILMRAAEIVGLKGWWQPTGAKGGGVCLMTAVMYAVFETGEGNWHGLNTEHKFAVRLGFRNARGAFDWNDSLPLATGQATVLSRLRAAAQGVGR